MQLASWLHGFNGRVRAKRQTNRRVERAFAAETLETKTLLTVTGVVIGTELQVFIDGNDSVSVQRGATGNVEVRANGSVVASIPNLSANSITSLFVDGSDTDNVIDVSSMTNVQFPLLTGITLDGGNGIDRITGSNSFGEVIRGGDGNDIIIGNGGSNTLEGGHGNDVITGGSGAESINGGDGQDTIDAGDGADSINGGDGNDSVLAGNGDDRVDASHGADFINGGAGNDDLIGGFGNDIVNGDTGNDTIRGGADNDSLLGGDGNDLFSGNAGHDTIRGEAGDDDIDGGEGNDSMDGGDGDDKLNGTSGNDTGLGGNGNDAVLGGAGNDSLDGQAGNDTVNGNSGNDSIYGGAGADSLIGNTGNDLIVDTDLILSSLPSLSIGNVTVNEGNAGNTAANFVVTLSAASSSSVTVQYATVAGTADNTDFSPVSPTTLTFAPGEVSKTITVNVTGDTTPELEELFFVALSSPTNALLGAPIGTATVTNDDGTGIRLLGSAFAGNIYDVDINTAQVTLVGPTGVRGIHDFTVGTGNVLYTTYQAPAITLATVNRQTALVTTIGALNPQPQTTIEGAIAFDVTQNSIFASFTGNDPRLYRIDPATAATQDLGPLLFGGQPITGFYNVDSMVFRGSELFIVLPTGPNAQLTSALLRIDPATRQVTRIGSLGVTLVSGASGLAYDQTTDSFLLVNGNSAITSTLYRVNATTGAATRIGDTGIFDMSGLTLDAAQLAPQIGVTINDPTVVEGTGGTSSLDFTLTLTSPATANITVNYSTVAAAATSGVDFNPLNSTVTFTPGQSTQTISIPIVSDSIPEGTEQFFVRLNSIVGGAINDPIGIGTITDDDSDSLTNTISGGTGNDTIIGGIGGDIINGDEDNDLIDGRDGDDTIAGGTGNDSITGGQGNDTVNGSAGNDTLDGGSGNDTYVWDGANAGTKVLADTQGFQTLQVNGTTGVDAFSITNVTNRIRVARGAASITTNTTVNSVVVNGGAGNDTFTVGTLTGVLPLFLEINGGDGRDTVNATGASLGNVRFRANGDADNDTLNGSNSSESLNGGDGDDSIVGNSGDESISGGAGIDNVNAGAGNDSIFGDDGDDSMLGGTGNDVIIGGEGNDYGDGQDGNDSILGGNGNDTATGSAGNDTLRGENGDDAVFGGTDNDVIDGGVGNDRLRGHSGDDQVKGGDGNDTITGDAGIDTIDGGDGDDSIDGGFGIDSLPGSSGGIIAGGDGNDTIVGGADDDTIIAGDGHDIVLAAGGQDVIFGGDGDDTLNGDGGTDQFNGGQGTNTLDAVSPERDNQFLEISTSVLQALAVLSGL